MQNGEKRIPKFGANKLFVTSVKKVADYFKKRIDDSIKAGKPVSYSYVSSLAELKEIEEADEAVKFIAQLMKMPNIDYDMVVDGCNGAQTKAWAVQLGIDLGKGAAVKKTETLKKMIKEEVAKIKPSAEKTQPQDEKRQAEILKKGAN